MSWRRADEWSPTENTIEDLFLGTSASERTIESANHLLRLAEIRVQQEQIKASQQANELAERLLLSNEQAGQQNAESARTMNAATQQLAKSTSLLNRATWVLAGVGAVQVIITGIALFRK